MKPLRFTLVADGTTDGAMLIPILEWLLRTHCPTLGVEVDYIDPSRIRRASNSLKNRIAFALEAYPSDCIFIHRDAEAQPAHWRRREIQQTIEELGDRISIAHVCVVPIRMSEAWLLFDESAIRRAAGNPNGRVRLELPDLSGIEDRPDPKQLLRDLLIAATEFSGRRRRSFDLRSSIRRVARLIDDYSPLRRLSAFRALEDDVVKVVAEKRWNSLRE
jgi:hypothetical protein